MSLSDLFGAFKKHRRGQAVPAPARPGGEAAFPDARTGIHPWLKAGDRLVASLQVDGHEVCRIDEVAPHDGMRREPSAEFRIPAGARKALLTGTLTRQEDGRPHAFKRGWDLADAAAYTAVLHDGAIPLDQRLLRFAARLEALAQAHDDYRFRVFRAEPGAPVDDDALAEAGRRLGLRPPPVLARSLGLKMEVGNSHFHRPGDLATVEKTLLSGLWGHQSLEARLRPDVLARYRRSMVVFTEVGDGLGALAYDPRGVEPGEPSNAWGDAHGAGAQAAAAQGEEGAWFWLHQGSLNEPTLLLDGQRRPVTGEEALLSVLRRLVVDVVLDAVGECGAGPIVDNDKAIWVDSAHPRAMMQLHFEGKKPRLWLRSYDHHYALL